VWEGKYCARCGLIMNRKVMLTAKYCSAECRQKSAKEAYIARHGKSRLMAVEGYPRGAPRKPLRELLGRGG
jgi:hypothetical protein